IVRLTFVATSLHLFGSDSFFLAHSILGRLLFYVLMLTFYFTIFTRGQLIQVASQNRETT
ncbi:MAG: exosortase family protein XrtG, partial [Leuconostoc falkenbergense]